MDPEYSHGNKPPFQTTEQNEASNRRQIGTPIFFEPNKSDNLTPEDEERIRTLNLTVKGLNIVKLWIEQQSDNTDNLLPKTEELLLVSKIIGKPYSLLKKLGTENESEYLQTRRIFNDAIYSLEEKVDIKKLNEDDFLVQKTIEAPVSELTAKAHEMSFMLHSINTPALGIAMTVATINKAHKNEDKSDLVEGSINQLKSLMPEVERDTTDLFNRLEVLYPEEQLDLDTVKDIIFERTLNTNVHSLLQISRHYNSDAFEVTFSHGWLRQVVGNVVQNTIRQYRQLYGENLRRNDPRLRLDITVNDDEENVFIIFDDWANGFSQKIIENGFEIGISTHGGTGRGISLDAENIKHYGAKIIPSNKIAENGDVEGARLVLSIPKQQRPADIVT